MFNKKSFSYKLVIKIYKFIKLKNIVYANNNTNVWFW